MADCLDGATPLFLLVGKGVRPANGIKEIAMVATGFERPRATLVAAVSLGTMIAAFAIGEARAQMVNPVPPPPPPVFNPSPPATVPQAPYTPVAPAPPGGLPSSAPEPVSPAIVAPLSEPPQTTTAPTAAKPALTPTTPTTSTHARHHGRVRHRWSRRRARFHAPRVLGPSYYPGLGEFYPPYANPCHYSRVWHGYFAPYWVYSCSW